MGLDSKLGTASGRDLERLKVVSKHLVLITNVIKAYTEWAKKGGDEA